MTPLKYTIIRSLLICFFAFLILPFNSSYAQAPKRVALLPFKINAEKDLTFMRDGIFDMLTSRLSKEGQVEVLSRYQAEEALKAEAGSGTLNEAAARRIGTRLNADFVLFGSLTVLGNNVSIDAKMVDISGEKPTMAFFDQSEDLGAVITKMNLIAADINAKIFGQSQIAATAPAPAAAAPAAKPPPKSDVHAHPEKLLQEDGFITQDHIEDVQTLGIDRGAAQKSQPRFWKSASFKHLINGVSVDDVDGDGKNETVTITPDTVLIFRAESGTFRKIAEIKAGFNKYLLAVDAADINANGVAEIFVTSLNEGRNLVGSYVIEYDGKNFATLIDKSRYYYRVANTPARGKILLGQRPRQNKPSAGGISEMRWIDGDYVPSDPIQTPRNTNLLGVTVGDVLNNGQEMLAAYKEGDRIQILDSSGHTLWDNRERFGGSMLYAVIPWEYRGQVQNKWYYPLRLVVWYNEAKKESEVIAVQNQEVTGTTLEQFRYFTKSHIAGFSWDGVGLGPSWKTRRLTGYIQDFTVGDFDNDGQDELIAALVIKEGRIVVLTEPKSTIIGYELSGLQQPGS